ncbi:uncharacterized protein [Mobula birostris]|uniref:uncharacterized protein isoform X2 n=1 Tax=Mobula birostris TaxID=1983395 RepID=UPI003B289B56
MQQPPVDYKYYSWQNSTTFTIRNTTTGIKYYHCIYSSKMLGRIVVSEESERVQIAVVDLPSPRISLASSHVSQGEDVTFNCTFTKNTSVGTFYLYKNGVRLNDSVPQSADAQNKSTTFTIRNVDPGNSGDYTCVYKLLEGVRYLMSSPSDSVHLSVSVKSIQRWIAASAVLAPVLMFGVLSVYCWKKGKARGRGELRC